MWQSVYPLCLILTKIPPLYKFVSTSSISITLTSFTCNSLQILLKLLSNCYLHTEIREKGGAYLNKLLRKYFSLIINIYGAGAALLAGIAAFSSYRDPNITKTLSVMDESVNWVRKNTFTDQVSTNPFLYGRCLLSTN